MKRKLNKIVSAKPKLARIEEEEEKSANTKTFDYFVGHFGQNYDDKFFEDLNLHKNETKEKLKEEAFKDYNAIGTSRQAPRISFEESECVDIENFSISSKLLKKLESQNTKPLHKELWQIIGRYMDLCLITKQDYTGSIDDQLIEQCRDQGLSRTRVLILCPMRKNAFSIVKKMIEIMFGKSKNPFVTNLAKFEKEFTDPENAIHEKRKVSSEFRELMSDNTDDCFRFGMGLAKKCLKLYTNFAESDILICSPLGLRMIIGDEAEEKRNYNILASIEVLIVDKAHIFYMQNWEHLIGIFQNINLVPSKITVDISRVRHWSIKEQAKYYRQTLVFSEINFVEIHAIFSQYCLNYAGQFSIAGHPKALLKQGLFRIDFKSLESQADDRFNFFIQNILPKCQPKTFIFIPSYFDFVRLRNYLKKQDESFAQIHEYAEKGKVAKARNMFVVGQRKLLLMTERFYFYYRYQIKGIGSVVFYQLPFNPQFYQEILNFAKPATEETNLVQSKALYNCFDVVRLQNIFGYAKTKELIGSKHDVHALVAE